eukprot:777519-Prymnesium_polylepis.1
MYAFAPRVANGVRPRRPSSRRSKAARAAEGWSLWPAASAAPYKGSAPKRPGSCPWAWRPALHEHVCRSRAYTAVVTERQPRRGG